MIFRSLALVAVCGDLEDKTKRQSSWFCLSSLREHIEVPESDTYWLEANSCQWWDGSGTRAKIRLSMYDNGEPRYSIDDGPWLELHNATRPYLRCFGCKPGGPAKVVYFRLLYEG